MVFFLEENGLKYALARRPRRPGTGGGLPDLFDSGELVLEQKDAAKPAFLKDFNRQRDHSGIGRSYRALQVAAALARFYERNLLHMEVFPEAWSLLHTALETLSTKPSPEVTLLKTCFLFARSEGYPVTENWLGSKPPRERAALAGILQQPVEAVPADRTEVMRYLDDLGAFFRRATDLEAPELPAD